MSEEQNWIKFERSLMKLSYKKRLSIEQYIGDIGSPSLTKPIPSSEPILQKLWKDYADTYTERWGKLQNCYEEFYGEKIEIEKLKDNMSFYLTGRRPFKRKGSEAMKFLAFAFQVSEEYILYGIREIEFTDRQQKKTKFNFFDSEVNERRFVARQNDTKTVFLSLSDAQQKALNRLVENWYRIDMLERWGIEIEDEVL